MDEKILAPDARGWQLAARSLQLCPWRPVCHLSHLFHDSRQKHSQLTDPENFFFRSCDLGDRGDKSWIPASFEAA